LRDSVFTKFPLLHIVAICGELATLGPKSIPSSRAL